MKPYGFEHQTGTYIDSWSAYDCRCCTGKFWRGSRAKAHLRGAKKAERQASRRAVKEQADA